MVTVMVTVAVAGAVTVMVSMPQKP